MSRRFKAGLAVLAACLLTASCAVDGRTSDPSPGYSAVPVSTLVSRRDLQFKLRQVQRGACRVTTLAYQARGAEPSPVAIVSSWQSGQDAHVSVQRLAMPQEVDASALKVATIEHLYAIALRQEPDARFGVGKRMQPCELEEDGSSHAEFLRDLARERQRALADADKPGTSVPWHVVSMAPAVMDRAAGDQVGVLVMNEREPMKGASIFFNRAPHSGCIAKTREDGVATCKLVDQHGGDDSHSGEAQGPVVAIYPGDVRDGGMFVPTTLVMRAAP